MISTPTKPVEIELPKLNPRKIHWGYLDGVRGVAALYVVLNHFILWNAGNVSSWVHKLFGWTRFGHYAVDVFITLSGLCLMLPIASRPNCSTLQGGLVGFFKRRARRIIPPYWAALAFSILLVWIGHFRNVQGSLSTGEIFSHILLLHNLRPDWNASLNVALWSIATEWQIYFVFALLLIPIWRNFGIGAAVAFGFFLGLIPHFLLPVQSNFDWACPWFIGLFGVGMSAALLIFRASNSIMRDRRLYAWIGLILAAVMASLRLVFGSELEGDTGPLQWVKDTVTGGIATTFLIYLALSLRQRLPSTALRVLSSKPLEFLGKFSYSLYLIHSLVVSICFRIQDLTRWSDMRMLGFRVFVGIPSALALSYLFYLAFERPFTITKPMPAII